MPHGQTGAAGIEVHISRMQHADDFTELEQVPVTSVRRTLLDISSYVPKRDLARAVDRAERLDLFDLQAVSELLLRTNGRRGVAALGAAIAEWQPRHTRSELEDRFADLVRGASLETPLLNTLVEGERGVHEVDAYWPSSALVVQLDGFAYHRTRRDRERDAAADADLELAGNRVVRLTWGDVVDYPRRTLRRLGRWISGV